MTNSMILCTPLGIFALWIMLAAAGVAKPEYHKLPHPTVQEMQEGLEKWAKLHPRALRVEVVGRTLEDLPLLLCLVKLTVYIKQKTEGDMFLNTMLK